MAHASFDGLRVLALESRRAKEVEKLIRTYRGEPFVVPSMREVVPETQTAALDFVRDLLDDKFDLVIFMTGVGVRALMDIAATKYDPALVVDALCKVRIMARASKPKICNSPTDLRLANFSTAPRAFCSVISS